MKAVLLSGVAKTKAKVQTLFFYLFWAWGTQGLLPRELLRDYEGHQNAH